MAIDPRPVIETDGKAIVLDLSRGSLQLGEPLEGIGTQRLGELIDGAMAEAGTGFAFGRYAEDRGLYDTDNFASADSAERRTVHLGIDLFCNAGTVIHSPLDGKVEIVAVDDTDLGYGPVLVVDHAEFFSLYGHLGGGCLDTFDAGDAIAAGQPIATVGSPPGNGNWPPHLHFQLILDLKGLGQDFPGVAYKSQQEASFALSPNPARFFPEVDAAALDCRSGL